MNGNISVVSPLLNLVALGFLVFLSVVAGNYAEKKGFSKGKYFVLSLLISPFLVLFYLYIVQSNDTPDQSGKTDERQIGSDGTPYPLHRDHYMNKGLSDLLVVDEISEENDEPEKPVKKT